MEVASYGWVIKFELNENFDIDEYKKKHGSNFIHNVKTGYLPDYYTNLDNAEKLCSIFNNGSITEYGRYYPVDARIVIGDMNKWINLN